MLQKTIEKFKKTSLKSSQLTFELQREQKQGLFSHKGGLSFYLFDFDDNIAILPTEIYVFHKETRQSIAMSSGDFAEQSANLGRTGPWRDYEVCLNEEKGSFQNFRDKDMNLLEWLLRKDQIFLKDLKKALQNYDLEWKGPSWNCFYHAVYNLRPLSLITARGHHPETLKKGIRQLVLYGHLPHEPNYLSLFPVNHPGLRSDLLSQSDEEDLIPNTANLKKIAIRACVKEAFQKYGYSPYHRFGISDDDPKNLEMILEEMTYLKKQYSENSFFVISTDKGQVFKREIFTDHIENKVLGPTGQLSFLNINF